MTNASYYKIPNAAPKIPTAVIVNMILTILTLRRTHAYTIPVVITPNNPGKI